MAPDPDQPDWWQHIDFIQTVSDGSGPPPYHVRDQEALYAALPPHPTMAANRDSLTPVRLAEWPATVWLPALEAATPMETPGPESQGWEWPSGASVLFIVAEQERLPGLWALMTAREDAWHVRVAGRSMRVRKVVHDDPNFGFSALVEGYLDDDTSFFAQANAPSVAECDALLAGVLTLESTPGTEGERRRQGGCSD